MSFGSRSAQTPSESSQDSRSNRGGGGDHHDIAGRLHALEDNTNYLVWHMWRKVGQVAQKGMPHHSQIYVTNNAGDEILNFGLFADGGGDVVFVVDEWTDDNPYNVSTSYKPNPVTVTGLVLHQQFIASVTMCGPKYKLLHNNCQKFARHLMTSIGAKHHRHLFHP